MSPASARPGCRRSEAVPPPRLDRHSQTPRRVEPIGAGPGWPPPLYLDFLGHFGGVSSGFPRAPKAAHSLAPAGLTRCQISAGRQVRGAVSCNSLICLEKSGLCPRQGPARDLGPMTPRWGEPPPAPGSGRARRGTRKRCWRSDAAGEGGPRATRWAIRSGLGRASRVRARGLCRREGYRILAAGRGGKGEGEAAR
jgi:hypothetical protein